MFIAVLFNAIVSADAIVNEKFSDCPLIIQSFSAQGQFPPAVPVCESSD